MTLHRYLLLGIGTVLGITITTTALVGGYLMRDEVHEMLDEHLMQIAQLAAGSNGLDNRMTFERNRPDMRERREREAPRETAPSQDVPAPMVSHLSEREGMGAERTGRVRNIDNLLVVQRHENSQITNLLSRQDQLPTPTQAGFGEVEQAGVRWRTFAQQIPTGWLLVAQPMEARNELVNGAILMAILPGLIALPLSAWLLTVLIRHALKPLHAVGVAMDRRPPLSDEPLPTLGLPAETQPLLVSFNRLLARVADAVTRERNFVTDAAHALRTPITALQLQVESLKEARTQHDHDERMADLSGGVARSRHTLEQLLTLARAEHHIKGSTAVQPAISALLERFHALLAAKSLQAKVQGKFPDTLTIAMHPQALATVLDNLMDNAIRYSVPNDDIVVTVLATASTVRISIRDFGPGLSRHDIERVFDRFYRAADDRTAGTGVGLSIVKSLCESVGGRAWLELPIKRSGLLAIIELPLAVD